MALFAPPTPPSRSEGSSPWVWPAGPDRPPCGLSAPRDPCWDFSPWYKKQEEGTPPGPYGSGLGMQGGVVRDCTPSLLQGLGLGDSWGGGGGVLGCRLAWTRPTHAPGFRERYGKSLKYAQVLAPALCDRTGSGACLDPRGATVLRELWVGEGWVWDRAHICRTVAECSLSKDLWHLAQPLCKTSSGRSCCPLHTPSDVDLTSCKHLESGVPALGT